MQATTPVGLDIAKSAFSAAFMQDDLPHQEDCGHDARQPDECADRRVLPRSSGHVVPSSQGGARRSSVWAKARLLLPAETANRAVLRSDLLAARTLPKRTCEFALAKSDFPSGEAKTGGRPLASWPQPALDRFAPSNISIRRL